MPDAHSTLPDQVTPETAPPPASPGDDAGDRGGPRGAGARLVATLRRHATLVGFAVVTVLAAVRYLAAGLDGRLDADAGIYAYGGQQAAEGVPPYVSVLNRSGPLGHLVPGAAALLARWTGGDDLTAMRLLYMALSVATVGLVYLLALWTLRSHRAGLVAGFVMLSFHGFAAYASFGPREKTLLVFFLVSTLALAARGAWLLTGVGIAAATLTWQPVFVIAFAAVVAMALLRRREPGEAGRLAALVRIALGGLVPTLLTVAAYAALGQLRVALDAFVLINLRYTAQSGVIDKWPSVVKVLTRHEGPSALFLVAGLVVLLALAVATALRARGTRSLAPPDATLVGLGVAAAMAAAWSVRAMGSWPDLFVFLPLAAVGVAGLVPLADRVLPSPSALVVAVVLIALAAASAVSNTAWLRENRELQTQREVADRINATLGPDATVLGVGASEVLVVMDKRNPIRFQNYGGGLKTYYRENLPGGLRGLARRIDRIQPDLIVTRSGAAAGSWRRPFMGSYEQVGSVDSMVWLASSSLPDETREELRDILADYDADDMSSGNLIGPSR